jgi:hypothetical protein
VIKYLRPNQLQTHGHPETLPRIYYTPSLAVNSKRPEDGKPFTRIRMLFCYHLPFSLPISRGSISASTATLRFGKSNALLQLGLLGL